MLHASFSSVNTQKALVAGSLVMLVMLSIINSILFAAVCAAFRADPKVLPLSVPVSTLLCPNRDL